MKKTIDLLFAALAMALPALALAQSPPPAKAVAQAGQPSAFESYQPYQDLQPGDWRAVNDVVGQAALKDVAPAAAAAPAPAAAGPAAPARIPAPMRHDAHHGMTK